MRCCVKNCTNNTKQTRKHGITFYMFPKKQSLRTKWIEALGSMGWEPKYNSTVCSEHFQPQDLYKTKCGSRLIKNGAIPILEQDSKADLNSSAVLKVCRICLAMDRKLYHIIDCKLDLPYQQITGLRISEDDNLPQKLCWECRHRLVSCQRFRRKAIMSQELMSDVLGTGKDLTMRCVKSISRRECSLSSTLTQKFYHGPHNCDIYVKEEEAIEPYIDDVIDDDKGLAEDATMKDNLNHDDEGIIIKEGSEYEIKEVQSKISTNIKKNENYQDLIEKVDQNKRIVPVNNHANSSGVIQKSLNGNQCVNFDDITKVNASNCNERTKEPSEDKSFEVNMSLMEPEREIDEGDKFLEENNSSEIEVEKFDYILKMQVRLKKAGLKTIEKKKEPVKFRKKKKDDKKMTKNKNTDGKNVTPYTLIDALFTVTKLTLDEQLEDIARRKDSLSYKTAPYKCETCYRGFPYKNTWEVHNRLHNKDSGEFECQICKARYMTRTALTKHIRNHAEKLSCNRCDFVTKHRVAAKQHIDWHDGVTFKCQRCPSEFKNRSTYLSHLRIKHVTDYVCELCGFAFLNEKGVFLHKRLNHKINPDSSAALDGPYCEVCEVRFASETAYDTHLKVSSKHSTDDDPKRIRNEYSDIEHARRGRKRGMSAGTVSLSTEAIDKHKPKLVDCEQCGVQLDGMMSYMLHFKREHPDKHRNKFPLVKGSVMCDQCGNMFQSKELLLNHMWIHTGEKRFQCLLCDKSFSNPRGLMLHEMAHNGKTPVYDCEVCGKGFSFQSNRKRHMRVHSELKPFNCNVCEKTFKTNADRRAHYEHVHLKKPWPNRSQRTRTVVYVKKPYFTQFTRCNHI